MSIPKMRIFATPIVRVIFSYSFEYNFGIDGHVLIKRLLFNKVYIGSPVISIIKLTRSSIKFLLGKITDGDFPILSQATFTLAYPLVIRPVSLGARVGVRLALRLSAELDRDFPNFLELFLVDFRQLSFLY